jgi:hypothetical protein
MGFEPTTFCMAIRSEACGQLPLIAFCPLIRSFRGLDGPAFAAIS